MKNANCAEEQKRQSEVRESKTLDEEIEDDRSARKKDYGQLNQVKKATVGCFGALREKEGKTGW
jgi:hypothetical protein